MAASDETQRSHDYLRRCAVIEVEFHNINYDVLSLYRMHTMYHGGKKTLSQLPQGDSEKAGHVMTSDLALSISLMYYP